MLSPQIGPFARESYSEWVRLRTLILLRWLAIFGQLGAIAVAHWYFQMQLPLAMCFLAVGTSVTANLISIFLFPENKRLSDTEAMLTLLFDLAQLSFLVYLTGGLTNPFVLLILVPVTVSALALELNTTILLGSLTVIFLTLTSFVHLPLRYADGTILSTPPIFEFGFWLSIVIGIIFLGIYSHRIASEMRSMSDALLATQMALAREQKLTDLGGVVAAAAHELGTPLATIKLVSSEMIDELDDQPDLAEDARLIRDQADRCRDILRSMGRAGKDDLHMRNVPISALVNEAAEPHQSRGKQLRFSFNSDHVPSDRQPQIQRRPEMVHGLRNLVQNAVDFARATVWVDVSWGKGQLIIKVSDDGEGYPPHLIGRIGDPFVRSRRSMSEQSKRPEYEGMGLGLFIAKTLLERTGARLTFANGSDPFLAPEERPERSGAVVQVVWPLDLVEHKPDGPLGENVPFFP